MKFAKLQHTWDGGINLCELVAIYHTNSVESEYFINGKPQTGCKWSHDHRTFSDMIERNGWKLVSETMSSEQIFYKLARAEALAYLKAQGANIERLSHGTDKQIFEIAEGIRKLLASTPAEVVKGLA